MIQRVTRTRSHSKKANIATKTGCLLFPCPASWAMKTRVAEPLKRGKSLAPVNQVTVVLRVALSAFFGDPYYGRCVLVEYYQPGGPWRRNSRNGPWSSLVYHKMQTSQISNIHQPCRRDPKSLLKLKMRPLHDSMVPESWSLSRRVAVLERLPNRRGWLNGSGGSSKVLPIPSYSIEQL